jgi:hypothetical protein
MRNTFWPEISRSHLGPDRMSTEDHEDREEITLDGLPVDVPDCEVTSEAFGRLKCAFLKWKLTLRPRRSCRAFPLLRDLRVLLCGFSSFFAAPQTGQSFTYDLN